MNHSYGTGNEEVLDSAVYGGGGYGAGMSMTSLHHQGQLPYGHPHSHVPRGAYGHAHRDVRARIEPVADSNDVVFGDDEDDENFDDDDDAHAHPRSTETGEANPSVPPNTVPSSEILQYLAQETRLFHEHVQAACKQYEETKKVPDSLFGVKKIRALQKLSGRKATAGVPRKLTAFNIFIKQRIEEMKAIDPGHERSGTEVFKRVVEEWRRMSAEAKKAFKDELPTVEDAGDGGKDGKGRGNGKGGSGKKRGGGGKRALRKRKPANQTMGAANFYS